MKAAPTTHLDVSSCVLPHDQSDIDAARQKYQTLGVVSIKEFLHPDLIAFIRQITLDGIQKLGFRRDLSPGQTGDSPRHMRNVRRDHILSLHPDIEDTYASPEFVNLLSCVTGETVIECPYEPEQYLVTCLEKEGDVQGWHLDDYSIAVIWVAEAPASGQGGFLQIARHRNNEQLPHSESITKRLEDCTIHPYKCIEGDVYIISSRDNLHRVYPTGPGGRRTIMNMTYAIPSDLDQPIDHSSIELLWSEQGAP